MGLDKDKDDDEGNGVRGRVYRKQRVVMSIQA